MHQMQRASAWLAGLVAVGVTQAVMGQETSSSRSWWLPENVATTGVEIDRLFYGILYLTTFVCVAVFAVLLAFLVRYRYQPGRRPTFIHGNNRLETVWTLIPALILVLISVFSQSTWSKIKSPFVSPSTEQVLSHEVVEMAVVGYQFKWAFHYPGADGKLGPLKPELVNTASGDYADQIGLDRSDEMGKDDIVSPLMYVPVNRKVYIHLSSRDVLHSFFLPNLRIKQDAVPGLVGRVWFEVTKTSAEAVGTYADGSPKPFDIVCAELCGAGHYTMRGQMFVVSDDEYQAFLAEEASYLDLGGEEDEGY